MSDYDKPDVLPAWAEGGDTNDVPTGAEIQEGWPQVNTPPTRQRFNWLLHWLSNGIRYFMQMGIPEWDAEEDYRLNSRVQKADGTLWRALRPNTNVVPGTSALDWVSFFSNELAPYAKLDGSTPYTGDLNMNTHKVSGVGNATDGDDAVNKEQFDTALATKINADGTINFTGHQKLKDSAPTDALHAASKGYVDAQDLLYATREPDLVINPHGSIRQESSATITGPGYFADQWFSNAFVSGAAVQVGVATDGTVSAFDPCHMFQKCTTAKGVLASGDEQSIGQLFEGNYTRRLKYGTANAKGSWLRIRASGSQAGVASFSIRNANTNRSYVQTFNVTTVPTDYWFYIPPDTTGTWATDNSIGARLTFPAAVGGTYATATLGAWQAGNFVGATTQSNWMDTVNRQLNITDVSWKTSAILLPFVPIDYAHELRRCQRYWESGRQPYFYIGFVFNASAAYGMIEFKVEKRAQPSMTFTSFGYYNSGTDATFTPSGIGPSTKECRYQGTGLTNWNGWNGLGTWISSARM